MPVPCRQCGATKTESARRGLTYNLLRALGYRLRKCSRCRRLRLLPERAFVPQGGSRQMHSYAAATVRAGQDQPAVAWAAADFDPDGFDGCPRCGSRDFKPTPRNWFERGAGRAPMARCRTCQRRFTYPKP